MHFRMKRYSLLLALAGITLFAGAQEPLDKHPETDNPDNIPYPVFPVPSDRQMDWFETEFYGFSHYGPNTFVGTEWGNDRKPNPKEYAPSDARLRPMGKGYAFGRDARHGGGMQTS